MTITHPHHPFCGQQLPVVCVRHGENPDVVVRLPDGSHAAVALGATDHALAASASVPPTHVPHLLDLQGLRRMAQVIDGLRRQGRLPAPPR